MKELNPKTAAWLRLLVQHQDRLARQYRHRLAVIWLGDDKKAAKAWLRREQIVGLPFGIIPADNSSLKAWRIHPEARSTTVLFGGYKTLATFTDASAEDFATYEQKLRDAFGGAR